MEVSSHSLSMNRVAEVEFDAAIFTNLNREHLDYHVDMNSYFNAKKKLFELLQDRNNSKKKRFAVLNGDDPGPKNCSPRSRLRRLRGPSGFSPGCDFRAEPLESFPDGTTVLFKFAGGEFKARLNLPGRHNVYNALAAAACASSLG